MKDDKLLGLGMSSEQQFKAKEQRIDLTESEYDKTVKLYEETGDIKYWRILNNCRIVCGNRTGFNHEPDRPRICADEKWRSVTS